MVVPTIVLHGTNRLKDLNIHSLDTMENEESFVHSNHKNDIIVNKDLFYLRQFRNVTITPHIAFYTDSAVFSMVKYSLEE